MARQIHLLRLIGRTNLCLLIDSGRLADGNRFPLGRYLLGSVYHILHQVAEKPQLGEPIGNLGCPWWFINMWLNIHMHKHLRFDFFAQQFPWDIAEDKTVSLGVGCIWVLFSIYLLIIFDT